MTVLTRTQFLRGDWQRQPVAPSVHAYAQVNLHCLTRQNVFCRTCAESCEAVAISFVTIAGRVPRPDIDPAQCIGCGECLASCPAQAIFLRRRVAKGEPA